MAAWQIPDTFPDVNQLNNGEQATESTPCAPSLFNFLVLAQLYLGGTGNG